MKHKLRLSYTFLLLWSQGRIDDALAVYFHKPTPKSLAMEDGIAHHKKWEKEIKKTNKLVLGKNEFSFVKPKTEEKLIVAYNDRWDLSGTIDCLDNNLKTIYEFKTGTTNGLEYASTYQLPMYFLICELLGLQIEKGILIHYNQHTDKTEVIVVWNSKTEVDRARNFIDSLSPEIELFFNDNKLFDKV